MMLKKGENKSICYGLSQKEADCQCKHESCRMTLIDEKLVVSYEKFRRLVDLPLKVLSFYRCPRHNDGVGAPLSQHQRGYAIDIALPNLLEKYTYEEIETMALQCGFTWIKIYKEKSFIHLDVR